MSRPTDPSFSVPGWSIPVWAPDTNYPVSGDPWSATPTKQAHPGAASVGFTPKAGVAAQCVNKLMNDAYATDASAKTFATTHTSEAQSSVGGIYAYLGQAWAMSWGAKVTLGGVWDVAWDKVALRWVAAGASDVVKYSYDNGQTWSAASEIAGIAGGLDCYTVAVDPSGNMVVLANSRDVYEYNFGTTTWTKRANALTAAPSSAATTHVLYDAVHSKWVAVYKSGGVTKVDTSTDRVTWTSRTPSTNMGFSGMAQNTTSGRIIVTGGQAAGTHCYTSYSDDGGVTWADQADKTVSASDSVKNSIFFDASTSTWYWGSSGSSNAWKSVDNGANWTSIETSFRCQQIMADGALILATRQTDHRFLFSIDGGTTWRSANFAAAGTISRLRFNGYHAMACVTNAVHATTFGVNLPPSI